MTIKLFGIQRCWFKVKCQRCEDVYWIVKKYRPRIKCSELNVYFILMICIWNLIPGTNSTSDYWKDK